jgi:hypothetical protein
VSKKKEQKNNTTTSLLKKGEVFALSQVVFNGAKPKDILEKRRPLESAENWTLDYRLDNYYPVQVSLFRRAMNDYLEVLQKADIQILTDSKAMQDYLATQKKFVNGQYYGIREWLFSVKAKDRQEDPNELLVPIVNFDFPKRFDNGFTNSKEVVNGIPYFETSNKSPIVDVLTISFNNVIEATENYLKVNVGTWVYKIENEKDISDNFYIEADKENYYLTIPELKDGKLVWTKYPYYNHAFGQTPYVAIGGVSMTEIDANGERIEYNVSDYYGAISYACYMISTMSDKQVIEARNNFPIKYKFQPKCTAHGCENGYVGFDDDRHKCTSCEGTGYQKDTNPFGDYVYEMSGSFLDDSTKAMAQPINYVVPPIDALNYISQNFKEYYDIVANELCISNEQNMTNQNAESKRYDLKNKITLVTSIVDDVIRVSGTILGFVESLLEGGKNTLTIKVPMTWNVKSNEDLLFQISEAKKNGSPYHVVKGLVKELMILELKDNPRSKEIVNLIFKKDKLITFGVSDLKDARIIYGTEITQREQVIHDNGLQILLDLVVLDVKPENLDVEFEKEIATYITPTNEPSII